jgi:hypothetical protein
MRTHAMAVLARTSRLRTRLATSLLRRAIASTVSDYSPFVLCHQAVTINTAFQGHRQSSLMHSSLQ